jgi:glyoxylase-like metal-dependent hydrolase (beta-lactamase superfamily II)
MLRLAAGLLAFSAAIAVASNRSQAQQSQPTVRQTQPPNLANAEFHVLPVQGSVYMVVGAGGNVTLQIGKDGVLLVDTSFAQMSDKLLAEIKKLSDKPIRYVINTHSHLDHVGGNENIAKAGNTIAGGNVGADVPPGATIIAHENVLNRMSAPTGAQASFPVGAWPTDTYFTKQKEIYFNDEAVVVLHQPNAHTDGDSIVYFRRSDVISTGDVFITTTYPVIDRERGGSINGIIRALNTLLDLSIPREKQEGGTYLIPGHGRLSDEADLLEYRDMLTIIRDRIEDLVKKGMTLEQVKAAGPTLDYDARYGPASGEWTKDMFVEAVFNDMKNVTGRK